MRSGARDRITHGREMDSAYDNQSELSTL